MHLEAGTRIANRYTLVEPLYEAMWQSVWKAKDEKAEYVAIKCVQLKFAGIAAEKKRR